MALVRRTAGAAALGVAMLIACGLSIPPARAGYFMTLTEQGTSVVATGSGSFDLTGLPLLFPPVAVQRPIMNPNIGVFLTVTNTLNGTLGDIYGEDGFTGPEGFGGGGTALGIGSGDLFGLSRLVQSHGALHVLVVPSGYASGNPLSDSATWDNQAFSSLGVTPGTYEWKWGTGPHADGFTLQIGPISAPEPSSSLLLGVAFAALLFVRPRRHVATTG